jgi:hypothetical protein
VEKQNDNAARRTLHPLCSYRLHLVKGSERSRARSIATDTYQYGLLNRSRILWKQSDSLPIPHLLSLSHSSLGSIRIFYVLWHDRMPVASRPGRMLTAHCTYAAYQCSCISSSRFARNSSLLISPSSLSWFSLRSF